MTNLCEKISREIHYSKVYRKIIRKRLGETLRSVFEYKSKNYKPPVMYSLSGLSPKDFYNDEKIKETIAKSNNGEDFEKNKSELKKNTDITFVSKMLEYIDTRNLKDTDVYKAAHVDRRLYSKMITDPSYKPSEDTCVALCLALQLDLDETNNMLSRAGYSFSHSYARDVILEYFFREKLYDIGTVNEILYYFNEKPLGRG